MRKVAFFVAIVTYKRDNGSSHSMYIEKTKVIETLGLNIDPESPINLPTQDDVFQFICLQKYVGAITHIFYSPLL